MTVIFVVFLPSNWEWYASLLGLEIVYYSNFFVFKLT